MLMLLKKESKVNKNNNKAISPMLNAILALVISLAIVFILLQFGLPYISLLDDMKTYEDSKKMIIQIDDITTDIKLLKKSYQELSIRLTKGQLRIDAANNSIEYSFPAQAGVLSENYFEQLGNVYVKRFGQVFVGFQADDVDLVIQGRDRIELTPGNYDLVFDFNTTSQGITKINVSIKE